MSLLYLPLAMEGGVDRVMVALILVPIGSAISSLTYALIGYPLFKLLVSKNMFSLRVRDQDLVNVND